MYLFEKLKSGKYAVIANKPTFLNTSILSFLQFELFLYIKVKKKSIALNIVLKTKLALIKKSC